MTVETVLTNVLLELGLDNATAQITEDTYEMRQIKAFMDAAGGDISTRAEWSRLYMDWAIAGAVDEASLPSDFQELAEGGSVRVNGTGYEPIRVIVAPEQFDFVSARPSTQAYCHLRGGKLQFSPTLTVDGAMARYVSKNWVEDRTYILQNGDNLNIPERLLEKGTIWRWKRQKGLPYDDALAEYEADLLSEIKADRGEA